jgi:cyclase
VIRKRLIGVVTVKDGWAVQSSGYRRYLPLGKPEILVENLDRWGADEILLQCIDRTRQGVGPDMALLEAIGKRGLSTPLIYGGGVGNAREANAVIQAAADRVLVDALVHDDFAAVGEIAEHSGAQAVIASLPLSIDNGTVVRLDYRTGTSSQLCLPASFAKSVSEVLVVDWRSEGHKHAFDMRLLDAPALAGLPKIAFGGLSDTQQHVEALSRPTVVAVAVGNFLAYREHAIQAYKAGLCESSVRPAHYQFGTFM